MQVNHDNSFPVQGLKANTLSFPKVFVKPDSLYFVDNGACYCGSHVGQTARFTGRDISGQKIERVTPKVLAECASIGFTPKCESCGRLA